MSKSTLSITVTTPAESSRTGMTTFRTVEVPCRTPESFDFEVFVSGPGIVRCVAYLTDGAISDTEAIDYDGFDISHEMDAAAESILATVKSVLGLSPQTHSVAADIILAPIALAYEAECAAHDAQVKALQALPRTLQNPGLVSTHPSERESYSGGAVGMLAQYVAWVFEQACKAQTERAEVQAKVTP